VQNEWMMGKFETADQRRQTRAYNFKTR